MPRITLPAALTVCTALALAGSAPAIVILLASNVLVNHPAADATNQDTQSTATIERVDSNTLVAAFVDSGSYIGGASKFTGFSRSTNNGGTWTDLGALPTSSFGDASFPRLRKHTSSGALFLTTLPLSVTNAVPFFKSTDGGATFGAPVNAAPGSSLTDLPVLASDNYAPSPFYGRLYVAWREFGTGPGLKLTHSTDNGATWAPSGGVAFGTAGFSHGASLVILPGASGTLDALHFTQGSPSSIGVSDHARDGHHERQSRALVPDELVPAGGREPGERRRLRRLQRRRRRRSKHLLPALDGHRLHVDDRAEAERRRHDARAVPPRDRRDAGRHAPDGRLVRPPRRSVRRGDRVLGRPRDDLGLCGHVRRELPDQRPVVEAGHRRRSCRHLDLPHRLRRDDRGQHGVRRRLVRRARRRDVYRRHP